MSRKKRSKRKAATRKSTWAKCPRCLDWYRRDDGHRRCTA